MSSVKKLETTVEETKSRFEKVESRFEKVGVGALIVAVLTVFVAIPAIVFQATEFFADGKADSSTVTALEHKSAAQGRVLRRQIKELEALAAKQPHSASR